MPFAALDGRCPCFIFKSGKTLVACIVLQVHHGSPIHSLETIMASVVLQIVTKPVPGADMAKVMTSMKEAADIWRSSGADVKIYTVSVAKSATWCSRPAGTIFLLTERAWTRWLASNPFRRWSPKLWVLARRNGSAATWRANCLSDVPKSARTAVNGISCCSCLSSNLSWPRCRALPGRSQAPLESHRRQITWLAVD